jgi:asparagine synthase (glutamine-hydrolysing)
MCGIFAYDGDERRLVGLEELKEEFEKLSYRGPDQTSFSVLDSGKIFGFHRLAIMDLTSKGDQPFQSQKENTLICNGEVYNHKKIFQDFKNEYEFKSTSDCETILPLYERYGLMETAKLLDAEFALVLWDEKEKDLKAARDPIGIRPLFYGYDKQFGKIMFASEAKSLLKFCKDIKAFPPGHIYEQGEFKLFKDISISTPIEDMHPKALEEIRERLISGVVKRMDSDAPMGYLLSGGLDSSLVCAIAAKHSDKPIKTFAVGIEDNPIDTKYAKVVADYLGTEHHEVLFTKKEMMDGLKNLIYRLETWDTTTIRASIGMDLVCKYVRAKTDVKVLMTGEVSDEIFGYKYTDFAPSKLAFHQEAQKRVRELYKYDVLRADRCISSNSLEARVPFGDLSFVEYVMSLDPELKMNTNGVGKYLLRESFKDTKLLPESILMREKAAFSDAVGHAMVDTLKAYAEEYYSDEEFEFKTAKIQNATPKTKEALLYREIFEEHFEGCESLIGEYWMPNKEWENCDVDDPSARALPNYGKSGE